MGWLFYHRDKGAETDAEHFAAKLDTRYEIIAHGTVESVFYAAVRDRETGKVSAFIALTRWTRDTLHNFGYKDMGESVHPYYYRAPKAVLDALTPTTHEDALTWRANCRRYHDQRDFLRKHLKSGTKIRLTHAMSFTDKTRRDTFTYARPTGHRRYSLVDGPYRFRIPNWRDSVAALIHPDGSQTLTPVGQQQAATAQAPAAKPQPKADAMAAAH